jgi:PAS domain S-box-containing protein
MNETIKILHLEDMPTDAELVERALKKGNIRFEKRLVDNKADFIRELTTFVPDIVLSDHSLPSFNSIEALKVIKEKGIKVPFILITSTISEEFAVEMMQAGANDYILKDRMQRLPGALLNAIEKHELEVERQAHVEKIIASESMLRNAEKLAHTGSWELNLTTGVTKWSDEAFRIYGYEPGDAEPSFELFKKHLYPEDRGRIIESLEHAMKFLHASDMNFRIIDKNKQLKYIRSVLVVDRNSEGHPVFLTGFNQDISEIMLATESVKSSEANLRTILENSNTAYILIAPDFNIITFNALAYEYAERDLGADLKEGVYGIDYFPENRRPILKEMLSNALSGVNSNYEVSYPQPDGTFNWYDCNIHGIQNEEKKFIGMIMSLSNITERKTHELQREKMTNDLIQRNKDLEQFAYIVSHNLRAPVANILGFSQVMESADGMDEEMKTECLKGIAISVNKLDNVVHDLNHILQIKREINEKKELVKFSQLVYDIQVSIASQLKRENVNIVCDFSAVNEILSIKSYQYSIFYNLISNGIKYKRSDIESVINISSSITDGKIEILFADNGIGMDLEVNRSLVFGLYKRFHNHVEGKGMGLFMTKTQVESLGGSISVSSEINKGTEFKITFYL